MRSGPQGLYVVAGVVIDADPAVVRAQAWGVLLPRQPRFHWRDETEQQRQRMLELVGRCEVLAYTCAPVPPSRMERARAMCLSAMLWDFCAGPGPTMQEVVLESRQERLDRADRRVIEGAKRSHRAPASLAYTHRRPLEEPLLWLADAAAGAVSAAQAGENPGYVDRLGAAVSVRKLSL